MKNKTPEPSSEDEVCLDETALCDDSSDAQMMSHVQTSLSSDDIDIDDHILVKFQSKRTTQYYIGGVLEFTKKEIRSTFMRKNCSDKFGNVHSLEDVVFKLPIPVCGKNSTISKIFCLSLLSFVCLQYAVACRSTYNSQHGIPYFA